MGVEDYVEKSFPIECRGRDGKGKEVLHDPIFVKVIIYKNPGSSVISSNVKCPYNAGSNGQRCKVTELGENHWGKPGVRCPYHIELS